MTNEDFIRLARAAGVPLDFTMYRNGPVGSFTMQEFITMMKAAYIAGQLAEHYALEVRVPSGWKLVPIEPTEDQLWCLYGRFVGQLTTEAKLYSDMLDAAPPAPEIVFTEREECPAGREPLSTEHIESLLRSWPEDSIAFFDFARAIEEARGITQEKHE